MRASLAIALFACMLALPGLTGCTSLSKKGRSGGTDPPFVGSPSSGESTNVPDNNDNTFVSKQLVKPGKGMLAGHVKDTANRGVPDAAIKIVEAESGKEAAAAPLTILTDKNGHFDATGLDAGRWYVLTVRKRDGNRYMTGSAKVRCSNVNVILVMAGEEAVTGNEKVSNDKLDKEEKSAPASAAALAPTFHKGPQPNSSPVVVVPPEDYQPAPVQQQPKQIPLPPTPEDAKTQVPDFPAPKFNGETIADGDTVKGFPRLPAANIPGPGQEQKQKKPAVPPPPMSDAALQPSTAPSARLSENEKPATYDDLDALTKVVVPSCVKFTRERIENFALYDYNGNVWEWKKKRKGKLTVVSFWYSQCPPCKPAIPFLNRMSRDYGDYGLDVVSIAHESGTPVEKQDAVRPVREQYKIAYPILFTGSGDCPVLRGFEVHRYPTLLLLDETGKIVWRTTGVTPEAMQHLEQYVRLRLRLRQ